MADLEPGQARIRHPDLGEQVVLASQVPHLERAGWEFVEGDRETWPKELQPFEGQPRVRIYHPGLDRYETVAESAVAQHRSRDWVLAEEWDTAKATADLDGKTAEELRELARERGLKVSGSKDDLLARLRGEPGQDQEAAGDEPAQPSEEE